MLVAASWIATILACGRFEDLIVPFGSRLSSARRRASSAAANNRRADDGVRVRLGRLLLPPWHAVGESAAGGRGGSRGGGSGAGDGAASGDAPAGPAGPGPEPRGGGGFEDAIFAGADGGDERDGPAVGLADGPPDPCSDAPCGAVPPDPAENDRAGEHYSPESPRDAADPPTVTVEDPDRGGRDAAAVAPDVLDDDASIAGDGGRPADVEASEAKEDRDEVNGRSGDVIDEGSDESDIDEPPEPPQVASETRPTEIEVTNETNGEMLSPHETVTVEPTGHDQGGADGDSRQPQEVERNGRFGDMIDEGSHESDIDKPPEPPQVASETRPTEIEVTNETNVEVLPSQETVTVEPTGQEQGGADGDSRQPQEVERNGRFGDMIDEGSHESNIDKPPEPPQVASETRPTEIEATNETNVEMLPSHETVTVEPTDHDQGGAGSDSRQPQEVEREERDIKPKHQAETPVQDANSSAKVAFKRMDQEEESEGSSEQGEECTAGQDDTADESPGSRFAWAPLIFGIASWLPAIYSVAVHIFLSTPNERRLTALHHWRPVAVRLAYGATASCCGVQFSLGRNGPGDMALVAAASAIGAVLLHKTRRDEVDGHPPPRTPLEGRVVFITGCNTGIGKETARELYQRGATVVFGCRSRARAAAAMKDIDPAYREGQNQRMIFVELDLAKLTSVRRAATEFLSLELPLHVLILNAGLMRSRREVTEDGLELTLAANVVGHFLLTDLLLPKLRETARAGRQSTRVVTVSSSLYAQASRRDSNGRALPGLDLNDLQCTRKRYRLFVQYAQTKLANILFSQELGRREQLRVKSLPGGSPSLTPGGPKKSSKTRLKPIEEPDNVFDDDLFGNFAVVSSPSTSTHTTKSHRPKLTPVGASNPTYSSDEESSDSEDELGFEEIATPSTTPSPSLQKKSRKRLMPIPLDSYSEDDNDIGLGYDDVLPSPNQTEKAPAVQDRTKVQPASKPVEVDDGIGYPVRSFCLHPGLVRTDVVRDMPWYLYYPNRLFSVFIASLQKTPRSGAYTSVYCATADCEETSDNEYFVNSKPQPLLDWAFDSDVAKGLWQKLSVMSS